MSEFRQPWRPVRVGARRVRLQILDPQTAFDFEAKLVSALGDTLSLLVASPDQVAGAVMRQASAGHDLDDLMKDPVRGPEFAGVAMMSVASVLAASLDALALDHRMLRRMFRRMILGKLEVNGSVIETARAYGGTGFAPFDKWRLLQAQVSQSYGPLWTRKPYRLRSIHQDYGVPRPQGVPLAVAWADALAVRGSAPSSHEVLTSWTPERMIQIVEVSAQQAEITRRSQEQARRGRSGGV